MNGSTVIGPITDGTWTSGDAGLWSYTPGSVGNHRFDNFSVTVLGGGVYRKAKGLAMVDARRILALPSAPPANTTYRVYYYANGKPIAMREMPAGNSTGTLYYLHSDHLGSTSVTTCGNSACGTAGAVVARQWYYPFGSVRGSTGMLPTKRTYTGQFADDTGLMYFNARYYSGALGRFVSADTIVPGAGNPQALNRYAFVLNNPIKYTDPSGHCAFASNGIYFDATACMGFIQRAYDSVMAGETRPEVIAMHLTGATDALIGAADYVGSLNTDVNVVFSQASLEERLPHAIHLGVNATLIAETIVGTAQMIGTAAGARSAVGAAEFCSFSPNTLISTSDGLRPISDIQVGNRVLALDEAAAFIGYYVVTATWSHFDPIIGYVNIDGEAIEVTPEHPFFTAEKGWVAAGDLWLGAHVLQADGKYGVVVDAVFMYQPQVMYNLTVADAHTYFVGEQQWLVHNACPIHGTPQSNTTAAHQAAQIETANQMAQSGKFQGVWLDSRVGPATGDQVFSMKRPDVMGLNFGEKFAHLIEFMSPSQLPGAAGYNALLTKGQLMRRAFEEAGWNVIVEILEP